MFYFQESRDYPQQTSLLGMLRYQLLVQNDLLTFDGAHEKVNYPGNAEKLIGAESFNETPGQNFGAIEAISPICLVNDKEWLFPFPVINQPKPKDKLCIEVPPISPALNEVAQGTVSWKTDHDDHGLFVLTGYKEKTGSDSRYSGMTTQNIDRGDLYDEREQAQIGINKPRRTADETKPANESADNEGFFKLKAQRLKAKVAFSFCVQLREQVDFTEGKHDVQLADGWVILGKERSIFKMRVSAINGKLPMQVPNLLPGSGAIWLLSDACVAPGILKHCQFAMTQPVSFRHMQSTLKQANHFVKPTRRNVRRELLQRGSLLFPKPGEQSIIIEALNDPAFTKIGYNHYTILT